VVSFIAYMRSYWTGTVVLLSTTIVFVILGLPLTAHGLMAGLQSYAKPLDFQEVERIAKSAGKTSGGSSENEWPRAIVVLGAGRYSEAPEYGLKDTVSRLGLVRLRYAAELQRHSGLPILVSGGSPGGEAESEAQLMRDVLVNDFKANVKWIESQSRNTRENAKFSADQLGSVRHVYLVTHAWHMRRAAKEFESAGIRVTAAPTGFHTISRSARSLTAYLPSSEGMSQTAIALRERIGFLWYGIENQSAPASGGSGSEPARTR